MPSGTVSPCSTIWRFSKGEQFFLVGISPERRIESRKCFRIIEIVGLGEVEIAICIRLRKTVLVVARRVG